MGLRHGLTVASLADIATRRHDQLQELADDDHALYQRQLVGFVTLTEVVNTAVETDLMPNQSVPANTLSAARGLAYYAWGDYLNNTLGVQNITFRIYFGGIVLITSGLLSLVQDVARRAWHAEVRLAVVANNDLIATGAYYMAAAGTVGGTADLLTTDIRGVASGLAIDVTAAQNARVTGQHGVANAALSVRLRGCEVRLLRP